MSNLPNPSHPEFKVFLESFQRNLSKLKNQADLCSRRRLMDAQDSDDLLQHVAMKAWENLEIIRRLSDAGRARWLMTALLNQAANLRERENHFQQIVEEFPSEEATTASQADLEEMVDYLLAAVGEPDRTILWQHIVEGKNWTS
jgi:DNA-directed RNA polymerase specialized sigma24 family protein